MLWHIHQQHELHAPHPGEQARQRVVALAARDDAVDLRDEHAGDRRGERHVVPVNLRAYAVNGRRRRAADDAQQRGIDRPVDLVDNHVQEDEEREAQHLPQQREVKFAEGQAHVQPFDAVDDAQRIGDGAEHQRNHHQRNRAEARQQQRQHDDGVEHSAHHAHHALKEELLLRRDVGSEHAARERHRDVDDQQRHQHARRLDLVRGHLRGEDIVHVRHQHAADEQACRGDEQEDRHEHAVHARHAVLAVARLRAGVIAHVCAAQPEAHQAEVGDEAVD